MITEHIGSLASLIGSLTVVGGALIWIYNKFIGEPRENRRAQEETQRHARMLLVVTKENEPLNKSIQQLTEWLNESKLDRKRLNELSAENRIRLDDHEERVDNLNERVIVLEARDTHFRDLKELFHERGVTK